MDFLKAAAAKGLQAAGDALVAKGDELGGKEPAPGQFAPPPRAGEPASAPVAGSPQQKVVPVCPQCMGQLEALVEPGSWVRCGRCQHPFQAAATAERAAAPASGAQAAQPEEPHQGMFAGLAGFADGLVGKALDKTVSKATGGAVKEVPPDMRDSAIDYAKKNPDTMKNVFMGAVSAVGAVAAMKAGDAGAGSSASSGAATSAQGTQAQARGGATEQPADQAKRTSGGGGGGWMSGALAAYSAFSAASSAVEATGLMKGAEGGDVRASRSTPGIATLVVCPHCGLQQEVMPSSLKSVQCTACRNCFQPRQSVSAPSAPPPSQAAAAPGQAAAAPEAPSAGTGGGWADMLLGKALDATVTKATGGAVKEVPGEMKGAAVNYVKNNPETVMKGLMMGAQAAASTAAQVAAQPPAKR